MAPTTTKPAAGLSSSAASSEHIIGVGPAMKAEDVECSDSAASSSMDHLAPFCSSSPGASYNGAAALAWHDDGDTTDDQDEAGWQLVPAKASHKAIGGSGGSSSAGQGHAKAAVCGRCGMKGHVSSRCRQPHCSRCNKWWHTEEECSRACHACGSLEHKISASTPLCKSYKCRECGLYGHVYAECPNIVCNLCKQVGHKALDCPSIICNLCKQQGHKAVNCPNPRGLQQQSAPTAGSSSRPAASKQAAHDEQQALKLRPAVPQQLRQSGSSCGSAASPTSFAAAAAAGCSSGGAGSHHAAVSAGHAQQQQAVLQEHVPLAPALPQPTTAAEMQARQQHQSQLLSQLYKAAPEAAVLFLDNSSKLQALYCIDPGFLTRLFASLQQQAPSTQQSLLEAAVQSVYRQQQHHHYQPSQQQQAWQQPLLHAAASSPAGSHLEPQQQQHPLRHALSCSSGSTPASPATPKVLLGGDVSDATQGIKPGDLAPQLAKQLVAEFGDMLPTRWQQLPSWRQLEARLSFPDGNYVQRRLQFREKRRQLQLLTLQMRAAAVAARQQAAALPAAAGAAGRPVGSTKTAGVRVVPQVPAAGATSGSSAAPAAARSTGAAPNSYAAALAGPKAASAAGASVGAPAAAAAAAAAEHGADASVAAGPAGDVDGASSSAAAASVDEVSTPAAALSSLDSSNSSAAPTPLSEQSVGSAIAVCRRCGMMGHAAQYCAQPKCSRCHLWWHSEAQCAAACQFCGSLDHQGDAEQPASCQSFRCKACKMFGHTASTCPHVQMHTQQEKVRQAQQQQQLLGTPLEQQQRLAQQQAVGISPVATPTSAAAVPSSLSSCSNSLSYQQLALQAPASPLSKFGGASSSSMAWDSPLRPPDSPGLGQNGVKPKDLLPEHAMALQEEFPNALPLNWQQMTSWRMVEERLRVVAVEGAVFSKRRQMWRDRRKHYQVLTAQALAAAARSAADDAAGVGATAAGEEVIAAVAQQGAAAAAAQSADSAASCDAAAAAAALEADAISKEPSAVSDQQQKQDAVQAGYAAAAAAAAPPSVEQHNRPHPPADEPQQQQEQPQQVRQQPVQQQQPASRQLALLAHRDDEDLVPEWQQQRGSLFGLSALPCGSQDGLAAAAPGGSSAFSCDTASFCCSPMPAVTPSVLMSPMGPDAPDPSAGNTPCPMLGPGSCLSTPGMFGGPGGPVPNGRLPVPGPLQQVPACQGMANMSPRTSGLHAPTPMPTPRGAAAVAAAMAAAASSRAPAMCPDDIMMGPGPGDVAAGAYSPAAQYVGPNGMAPRGIPMGYGMPQQSSPMPQHAAAGRGMPPGMSMNMAGAPAMYMLVAQRQSQLQQQLMLQSPYAPRGPAVSEAAAAGSQQAMLTMQMQQQQARMQRQRRLEQALGGQQMQSGPGGVRQQQGMGGHPEEFAETGELDDKLGVLGVLGLQ